MHLYQTQTQRNNYTSVVADLGLNIAKLQAGLQGSDAKTAELIANFHAALAAKDEYIASLEQNVGHLHGVAQDYFSTAQRYLDKSMEDGLKIGMAESRIALLQQRCDKNEARFAELTRTIDEKLSAKPKLETTSRFNNPKALLLQCDLQHNNEDGLSDISHESVVTDTAPSTSYSSSRSQSPATMTVQTSKADDLQNALVQSSILNDLVRTLKGLDGPIKSASEFYDLVNAFLSRNPRFKIEFSADHDISLTICLLAFAEINEFTTETTVLDALTDRFLRYLRETPDALIGLEDAIQLQLWRKIHLNLNANKPFEEADGKLIKEVSARRIAALAEQYDKDTKTDEVETVKQPEHKLPLPAAQPKHKQTTSQAKNRRKKKTHRLSKQEDADAEISDEEVTLSPEQPSQQTVEDQIKSAFAKVSGFLRSLQDKPLSTALLLRIVIEIRICPDANYMHNIVNETPLLFVQALQALSRHVYSDNKIPTADELSIFKKIFQALLPKKCVLADELSQKPYLVTPMQFVWFFLQDIIGDESKISEFTSEQQEQYKLRKASATEISLDLIQLMIESAFSFKAREGNVVTEHNANSVWHLIQSPHAALAFVLAMQIKIFDLINKKDIQQVVNNFMPLFFRQDNNALVLIKEFERCLVDCVINDDMAKAELYMQILLQLNKVIYKYFDALAAETNVAIQVEMCEAIWNLFFKYTDKTKDVFMYLLNSYHERVEKYTPEKVIKALNMLCSLRFNPQDQGYRTHPALKTNPQLHKIYARDEISAFIIHDLYCSNDSRVPHVAMQLLVSACDLSRSENNYGEKLIIPIADICLRRIAYTLDECFAKGASDEFTNVVHITIDFLIRLSKISPHIQDTKQELRVLIEKFRGFLKEESPERYMYLANILETKILQEEHIIGYAKVSSVLADLHNKAMDNALLEDITNVVKQYPDCIGMLVTTDEPFLFMQALRTLSVHVFGKDKNPSDQELEIFKEIFKILVPKDRSFVIPDEVNGFDFITPLQFVALSMSAIIADNAAILNSTTEKQQDRSLRQLKVARLFSEIILIIISSEFNFLININDTKPKLEPGKYSAIQLKKHPYALLQMLNLMHPIIEDLFKSEKVPAAVIDFLRLFFHINHKKQTLYKELERCMMLCVIADQLHKAHVYLDILLQLNKILKSYMDVLVKQPKTTQQHMCNAINALYSLNLDLNENIFTFLLNFCLEKRPKFTPENVSMAINMLQRVRYSDADMGYTLHPALRCNENLRAIFVPDELFFIFNDYIYTKRDQISKIMQIYKQWIDLKPVAGQESSLYYHPQRICIIAMCFAIDSLYRGGILCKDKIHNCVNFLFRISGISRRKESRAEEFLFLVADLEHNLRERCSEDLYQYVKPTIDAAVKIDLPKIIRDLLLNEKSKITRRNSTDLIFMRPKSDTQISVANHDMSAPKVRLRKYSL